MIPLQLPAHFEDPGGPPFVARLGDRSGPALGAVEYGDASVVAEFADTLVFQRGHVSFSLDRRAARLALGDVVFAEPSAGRISRWLRKDSIHNTLLVTERCDQLCVMCSQPPRKSHVDRFGYFLEACLLAPKDCTIGLSGGEPTLFLDALTNLVLKVAEVRDDIRFHILTNAQHFSEDHIPLLRDPAFARVLWGVPIYAAAPALHDRVVGKPGAFETLLKGLNVLALSGQVVELRTVLMRETYDVLPALAHFVVAKASFVACWALMQLEAAGFARTRWSDLFVDHSVRPGPLADAISLSRAHGVETVIYNTPHCTVPPALWPYLRPSISDWKRAFPSECNTCRQRSACSGLFTWRSGLTEYERAHPL